MTQGERIRFAREQKKLTQEELAKSLNTTSQTIYKYERDIVTNIPVERVAALSRRLGVSVAYIIFGSDEKSAVQTPDTDLADRFKLFSALSPESQKVAADYIRYLAEREGTK